MLLLKVSVVIPVFNKEKTIQACINSLLQQSYRGELEIIIIDDHSNENSWQLIKEFSHKVSTAIQTSVNRGPAFCRNLGIKLSSGDIIFFIDADAIASPNWIEEGVKNFKQKNVVGVEGLSVGTDVVNDLNDKTLINPFYKCQLNDVHRDYPGGNIAYRRDVLLQVGGFNEKDFRNGREDTDLAFRVLKLGKISINKSMIVNFEKETWNFLSLVKNANRYYYDVVFLKNHHFFKFKKGKIIHPDLLRYLLNPFAVLTSFKNFSLLDFVKFYIYLLLVRFNIWKAAIKERVIIF